MNLSDEIRKQIEKNKGLKLAVGEINNHLSILEGLVRKDIEEQKNEAYQRGYDKGYADKTNNDEVGKELAKDIYQRGLDDAWEAAKKISLMTSDEIEKVFPGAAKYNRYNLGYRGVEAIAKLKAYEEKRKADSEIKVGDEVYAYTPSGKTQPFVIIKIYDEDGVKYYSGINANGNHVQGGLNYIKTGRHFPHVAELLKEMQS